MDLPDGNLESRCRAVIDRLLLRYGWKLLDREEFIERTLVRAGEMATADLDYLAFGVYNQAVHAACSGVEGPLRWEQGYTELFALLREWSRAAYPDVWEDAVQSALELTCERFAACIVPEAFFQFAWGQLQNAARSLQPHRRRKDPRPHLSLDMPLGERDATIGDLVPDPHSSIPELFLKAELSTELREILAAIERQHPGAARQLAAVRLKYLDEVDDERISQLLGVPTKRVHELRSLGLKRLREHPSIIRLLEDT